jgi:phosphatidylglycerophosphate synthase
MSAQTPTTSSGGWPQPGDPGSGPHGRWTTGDVKRRTLKYKDAWWTVLLVDPVAAPIVAFIANYTSITPNAITVASLVLGLACAWAFWLHTWMWLVVGAVLYHLSFTLDCMDGKVARLKGNGSAIGGLLDYIFDRIRVLVVTLGLFGGQFHATGEARYLYAGVVTIFLDALRYMDAMQIAKVRRDMSVSILASREQVSEAADCLERVRRLMVGGARPADDQLVEATLTEARASLAAASQASTRLAPDPDEDGADTLEPEPIRYGSAPTLERAVNSEISTGFNRRVPWYPVFRDWMLRHRIRTHLVSGVEFQMFVFIVGPLLNQVLPIMIAAGVGLLGFEVVILVKLAMSTSDFARLNAATRALAVRLDEVTASVDPDGTMRREVAGASS